MDRNPGQNPQESDPEDVNLHQILNVAALHAHARDASQKVKSDSITLARHFLNTKGSAGKAALVYQVLVACDLLCSCTEVSRRTMIQMVKDRVVTPGQAERWYEEAVGIIPQLLHLDLQRYGLTDVVRFTVEFITHEFKQKED